MTYSFPGIIFLTHEAKVYWVLLLFNLGLKSEIKNDVAILQVNAFK